MFIDQVANEKLSFKHVNKGSLCQVSFQQRMVLQIFSDKCFISKSVLFYILN